MVSLQDLCLTANISQTGCVNSIPNVTLGLWGELLQGLKLHGKKLSINKQLAK
jgi:hypothetical protein